MNWIRKNYLILVILIIAAVLRLWNISKVPPGLTWDEAALGYNSYSLLLTAKDEYGNFLPLNLKSFGDYKPAFYSYIDIPFVALLGLNELAVRLPSVLAGVGLVLVVYLLIIELFGNLRLAQLVAFMLTISPLAIQFSRVAIESNLALFLNALATYFFIKARKSGYLYLISVLLFSFSLFTYQASRLFVPMLILGLLLVFRKQIKLGKWLIGAGTTLVIFLFILVYSTFTLKQSDRLVAMNFFAYRRSSEEINLVSKEDSLNKDSLTFQILHGEWFTYLRGLTERYLIYFSPRMLFIDGDYNPRHRVPDLGVLYYFSAVLIPLGIICLFKLKNTGSQLVLLWLLIAPLPAVLSRDLITFLRAFNLTLPYSVLEGAGLYYLLTLILSKKRSLFLPTLGIVGFVILVNLFVYLDRFYVHMPKQYSQGWLYGYREVFNDLKTRTDLNKYNKVVMTDKYGQPYIYYLFYTKYLPQNFQKQAKLDQPTVDVGTVRSIDNIEFRHVYWPKDRGETNSLFIGSLEELPDQDTKPFSEYKILNDYYFLDGQHAFRVLESK